MLCVTHAWPNAERTAIGPPAAVLRATTFIVAGSTTSISFASMHGTQSCLPTIAEPSGLRATFATPVTFSVAHRDAADVVRLLRDVDVVAETGDPVRAGNAATSPVILFVAGSMRTTLPSVWSLTHSAPRYAVSPFGSVPTLIFLTTLPFVIRHTVPSPAFATHADPNPHSMSYG